MAGLDGKRGAVFVMAGLAERYETILAAIQREKNLKHWPRAWKLSLIEASNPAWNDLYDHVGAAHCG